MIMHDDFKCFEKMEAFKIGDAYELHYCDIIFVVKFDPSRVIAIPNCETFIDDGTICFKNDEYHGEYHVDNDSIHLLLVDKQNKISVTVEITLIGSTKIHVEYSSVVIDNYHDYFDVDVTERRYLNTKSARM